MALRVRHVACVAPPLIGGIGSVAWQEVQQLQQRGLEAELVVPDRAAAYPAGIQRWPTLFQFGNAAILKNVRALSEGIDVLHLHYPFFGTAERILWSSFPVPVVVSFHMDAMASGWKNSLFLLQRHILQTRLLSRAARVLVSSQEYAEQSSLAEFAQRFPQKISILPFGVDTERFNPQGKRFSAIPPQSEELTVLFVGGLDQAHAFKGVSLLLQAMVQIKEARLFLVGDGDLRESYQQQAKQLGIGERVVFLGRVSDEALPEVYRSVDVCVLPSLHQAEAFGLVLIEAQASGTPVIASDLAGVRTVLRDGETGRLIQPGNVRELVNALHEFLDLPDWRRACGIKARQWVIDHFSWTAHTEALRKIYQEVCASR